MAQHENEPSEPVKPAEHGPDLEAVRERHEARSNMQSALAQENQTIHTGAPWRGLTLGLFGVVILSVVTPYADAFLQSSGLAATYLPTGVFLLFLFALGINTALRFTRMAFTQQELMLAYVTMLVPSAIPSDGLATRLVPLLVELYYYATPINEWAILHQPNVPHWMTPQGQEVIDWFFTGKPTGAAIPWEAWMKPLALWILLAAALCLIMISLSVAFRKRWMDAERLQFPLAQIPLMVMGDDPTPSWYSSFFRQPLVWAGIAIPFFFHTVNGLNIYFPSIPPIGLANITLGNLFSGSRVFTDVPFYRWANIQFNFYWSIVGISYLLRSEVSLSVWVFEWFYYIEHIIFESTSIGDGQFQWTPLHTFGYTLAARYQRLGAMVLAMLVYFIASRGEIREVLLAAFGQRKRLKKGSGAESSIPWWSLWAFLLGVGIYFSWTAAAGIMFSVSFLLLFFFLVIAITTARIVAATGLLWVHDYFVPMHGMTVIVGSARVDPRTWTNMGFVDFSTLSNRANIMPQLLDGMKIARQTSIRHGHYFLGVGLGLVTAVFVSFAMILWLAYTYGGANLEPWHFFNGGDWLFNRTAGFQRYHVYTHWTAISLMGAGAVFMSVLLYLHRTFLWWPIYPLGFLIGDTVASNEIWFPVFLGWVIKAAIIRFSGASAYNRLKNGALGLILGEFLSVGLWLVIDGFSGVTLHRVFPK